MTLLEILVKELPGKGGWPKGANFLAQDSDWDIYGFEKEPTLEDGHEWLDGTNCGFNIRVGLLSEASDKSTSIITREQYETALAESKSVEWDGEGLPPVGCVVERSYNSHHWYETEIVAHSTCSSIPQAAFCDTDGRHNGWGYDSAFRPLCSEEERKRDDATGVMQEYFPSGGRDFEDVVNLYDAIAAGKIPHVKIV